MIICDFCGAVTNTINHRCMACGKPMFFDWHTVVQGNVREMCVTGRDKAGQGRSGWASDWLTDLQVFDFVALKKIWSEQAHKLKARGSNPLPATKN